jgi:hypothetical protein
MSDFKAALPIPAKWSVRDNRFDQTGKNPRSLSIFVPAESAMALAQYIMNCADDASSYKTAKVWDYDQKCEVEVQGFYINGKGRDGADGGSYGNINPASTKFANGPEETPF